MGTTSQLPCWRISLFWHSGTSQTFPGLIPANEALLAAYIYIKELYRYNSVFNLQNRARKYFCINYHAGCKDIKYDIIMSQIELEHTQIQNTTCLG